LKEEIESLMNQDIPFNQFPQEVEVTSRLTPQEKTKPLDQIELPDKRASAKVGASFHKKSVKNSKEKVERKSYKQEMKEKYKKPIRLGDKIQNMKKKNKK
jgi:ATP-dependent RNA helicase RhlE